MNKISNVSGLIFTNLNTGEKILEIDNLEPATQLSELVEKPQRIKIPIEMDNGLLTDEVVKKINNGNCRMELDGNFNDKLVKITYHNIETDGRDFYALKLNNEHFCNVEEIKNGLDTRL